MIWRRRERGAGEEGGYDQEVYEYERPAVSALSELAPENEFYAGSRHVSIIRIDTRVSSIESWRLCRSCAYCEKLEPRDDHTTCPRCGDPMWSDEGQRHNMLPLRLVHAVTPDQRSRIVDDKDDREPQFYILDHVQDLEAVEGLDKVKVNPVLESELEVRFIEALRRMRIDGETPGVRHDLVQGRERRLRG